MHTHGQGMKAEISWVAIKTECVCMCNPLGCSLLPPVGHSWAVQKACRCSERTQQGLCAEVCFVVLAEAGCFFRRACLCSRRSRC
jgi:hypothetical protein